jgi:hypothetical protein
MVDAICRDGQDVFMGASVLAVPRISDPASLEEIACREALALAKDLYVQRAHISSNFLEVINSIKQRKCIFSQLPLEISTDSPSLKRFSLLMRRDPPIHMHIIWLEAFYP